ncbi:MAG: hypothetical protein ACYSWY_08675 [Planctomycetota bacterium]
MRTGEKKMRSMLRTEALFPEEVELLDLETAVAEALESDYRHVVEQLKEKEEIRLELDRRDDGHGNRRKPG